MKEAASHRGEIFELLKLIGGSFRSFANNQNPVRCGITVSGYIGVFSRILVVENPIHPMTTPVYTTDSTLWESLVIYTKAVYRFIGKSFVLEGVLRISAQSDQRILAKYP